jgi:gliding motility-associated-like protein
MPLAVILGASQSEYCGQAALQALSQDSTQYRWLNNTGAILAETSSFLAKQSGLYILEATSPEGCAAYDTAQIQIYDPRQFITFADTLFRCAADTFTVTAPQQAGFRFAWETPTGLRYTSDTLRLSPNSAPEGNYLLLITDTARNCTVADTFFLRVSPAFEFILDATDPTCVSYEDGYIQLETTQTLRVWLDGQELQANDSLGQLFRKDSLRAGVYLLELENQDSCHYAAEVFIEDPFPTEVFAEPLESVITLQEQVQLQASGAYTYTWYPTAGLSDPNSDSPTAQPDSTTTYSVIGSNEVGCTDTAQVTVFVVGLEDLLPSRVISPNGDNINDTWEILNLEKFPGLRVRVFNRWGQEVFASDNYDNTWDARAPNGELLPIGAYYYIFTLPNGETQQGHVNVVY